jgi:hypothetical protein
VLEADLPALPWGSATIHGDLFLSAVAVEPVNMRLWVILPPNSRLRHAPLSGAGSYRWAWPSSGLGPAPFRARGSPACHRVQSRTEQAIALWPRMEHPDRRPVGDRPSQSGECASALRRRTEHPNTLPGLGRSAWGLGRQGRSPRCGRDRGKHHTKSMPLLRKRDKTENHSLALLASQAFSCCHGHV